MTPAGPLNPAYPATLWPCGRSRRAAPAAWPPPGGSPRGRRRPRGPGRAAAGRVAAALGPAGRRWPAGPALVAAFPPVGFWPLAAAGPALLVIALHRQGLRALVPHRAGLRDRLLRAPAVLAGQRGLVRVGRAGHRRGGDLRAAGGGPAAPARAARLAAGGGYLVGGGRGDAVPLALCLPLGPPGDEPGGRAHRGLGRDRRTPAAFLPGRTDRGDAGVAGPGPAAHGLRTGPGAAWSSRRRPRQPRPGWPSRAPCSRWTGPGPGSAPRRWPRCRAMSRTPGRCRACSARPR